MSTAAARAEARRKAILARGTDRLAKLTTSARGEDAPAYLHDDPPLAPLPNKPDLKEFVGEQSRLPTPPARSRTASDSRSSFQSAGLGGAQPDPSVWSADQQQQLLAALMGGGNGPPLFPGQPQLPSSGPSSNSSTNDPSTPEDPLAAMIAAMTSQQNDSGAPNPFAGMPAMSGLMGMQQPAAPRPPKTFLQKLMPVVHMVAAWMLFAYFVLWKEPEAYDARAHGSILVEGRWKRWAELGWKNAADGWGVQTVPFFWAFTTLAIVLHSWRIFSGLDRVQTPMLLSFALPHLPPPLPSIIVNGLKYLQIGSVFLDDVAGLLVAIGLLIWFASWVVD
ncbi:hypothetical protein EUX98_g3793 [Antrodiella citrinella]|uniref:Golgi to ER traffic protein 2 n=1 Tax=Antrodiella citrinella TaxID=2447956 RepID=A0A4S4N3R9_9APHY|nr:hypothetical protein EUX98_g3793 [Antrodiella citrinella]